MSHPGHFS
ncbi:hypothetical protein V3C99_005502, partial [Haemonchus contortus]